MMDDEERLEIELVRRVVCGTETGTEMVRRWPRRVRFDASFLAHADPAVIRIENDRVTITVANGEAVYELDEPDADALSRSARLVSSRLATWLCL